MRSALLLSLLVLMTLVLPPPVAALETISSDVTKTVTVAMDSHDAYQIPGGKTAYITFAAGSELDFYAMNQTGYYEYTDPSSAVFHTRTSKENATSFSYTMNYADSLIFVVDNADTSTTGATPTGPVEYDIVVSFAGGSSTDSTALSLTIAAVAGVAVFGSIAAILWRQRKKKREQVTIGTLLPPGSIPVSPAVTPSPPPSPTPSGPMPPVLSQVVPQQVPIPEQAKKLKTSTLAVSAMTMGVAIAYAVVQDLITMLLAVVLMFATLGQISKLRKLRNPVGGG